MLERPSGRQVQVTRQCGPAFGVRGRTAKCAADGLQPRGDITQRQPGRLGQRRSSEILRDRAPIFCWTGDRENAGLPGRIKTVVTYLSRDFVPRRAVALVTESLSAFRVVVMHGARQVGKTTLARALAAEIGATYATLDDGGPHRHRPWDRAELPAVAGDGLPGPPGACLEQEPHCEGGQATQDLSDRYRRRSRSAG
jgi:hypothetical protein